LDLFKVRDWSVVYHWFGINSLIHSQITWFRKKKLFHWNLHPILLHPIMSRIKAGNIYCLQLALLLFIAQGAGCTKLNLVSRFTWIGDRGLAEGCLWECGFCRLIYFNFLQLLIWLQWWLLLINIILVFYFGQGFVLLHTILDLFSLISHLENRLASCLWLVFGGILFHLI